jgi:hypothetical protein
VADVFLHVNGRFSQRARTKEFAALTDEETASIEGVYQDLLLPFETAERSTGGGATDRPSGPAATRYRRYDPKGR